MTAAGGVSQSPRPAAIAVSTAVLAFAAVATAISLQKGAWYDEIWSLAMARHDLPLAQAIQTRWLSDIHPPLFYLLSWLSHDWVGDSIQRARGFNLLLALTAVPLGLFVTRGCPASRTFGVFLLLTLLGALPALSQVEEFRSQALVVATIGLIVMAFHRALAADHDLGRGDMAAAAVTVAAILGAFNLHYIATLIAGITVAVFAGALIVGGRPRWAAVFVGAAAVAGCVVVAWYLAQHRLVSTVATHYWATTSGWKAATIIGRFGAMMLVANLGVLTLAALRLWSLRSTRPTISTLTTRPFVAACLLAILLSLGALLLLNAQRPFLHPRYLSAEAPLCAAVIAAGAVAWGLRTAAVLAALAGTLVSLVVNPLVRTPPDGWDATARMIASYARACPDVAVHARPYWQMDPSAAQQIPHEDGIIRYGYASEAARAGFRLEAPGSARIASRCPTIIWLAHAPPLTAAEAVSRSGLHPGTASVTGATVRTAWMQSIVVLPPPAVDGPR